MALEMVETVRRAEAKAARAEKAASAERERILAEAKKAGEAAAEKMLTEAKKQAEELVTRAKRESIRSVEDARSSAQTEIRSLWKCAAEKEPQAVRLVLSEFY